MLQPVGVVLCGQDAYATTSPAAAAVTARAALLIAVLLMSVILLVGILFVALVNRNQSSRPGTETW